MDRVFQAENQFAAGQRRAAQFGHGDQIKLVEIIKGPCGDSRAAVRGPGEQVPDVSGQFINRLERLNNDAAPLRQRATIGVSRGSPLAAASGAAVSTT